MTDVRISLLRPVLFSEYYKTDYPCSQSSTVVLKFWRVIFNYECFPVTQGAQKQPLCGEASKSSITACSSVNEISEEFNGKCMDEHWGFLFFLYESLDQISAHLLLHAHQNVLRKRSGDCALCWFCEITTLIQNIFTRQVYFKTCWANNWADTFE